MSTQAAGLSPGQVQVLRNIVSDAQFRARFFDDPVRAVAGTDTRVTAAELAVLSRVTPQQIDALQTASKKLAGGADSTTTVALAAVFAVLFVVASL